MGSGVITQALMVQFVDVFALASAEPASELADAVAPMYP